MNILRLFGSRFVCLCIFGWSMLVLPAQIPTLEWVNGFIGGGSSYHNDLLIDSLGNVYTLGSFDAPMDIDPGPGVNTLNPVGNTDMFVCKMDSNGSVLWFARFGGVGGSAVSRRMAFDGNGNLTVIGKFIGSIDFDPSPSVATLAATFNYDGFAMKINPAGALVWAKAFGGTNCDVSTSDIAVYPNGSVLISGWFEGVMDADPGTGTYTLTNNTGLAHSFLLWLDGSGNFSSVIRLGNAIGNTNAREVEIDGNGDTYIAGEFEGTNDFDPGLGAFNLSSIGVGNLFVLKLNSVQQFVWAKSIGGANTNDLYFFEFRVSLSGNLFFLGDFDHTVDFDPGVGVHNLVCAHTLDAFVIKLNSVGNLVFARQLEAGNGLAGGQFMIGRMAVDAQERMVISGAANNAIDLDPSPAVFMFDTILTTADHCFLLQLDASGWFEWAALVGSHVPCVGYSGLGTVEYGPNHEIYLAGTFHGTVDFDLGPGIDSLNAGTGRSLFVEKLWACNSTTTIANASACDSFTWRGNVFTSTGTYYDVIPNIVGCDSILQLNLSIGHSTSHTITTTSCGPYTLNGTTYSASGTYTQIRSNVAGCDSLITLHLTVHSPSASMVTVTACSTYTFNGVQYNASGTYTQVRPNAQGCDSTITLQLTLNQTTYGIVRDTSCTSVTVNGHTYTSTGIYVQHFINSVGCDSILAVDVCIYSLNWSISYTGNGLISNAANADAYQWLDCDSGLVPIPGATAQTFLPTTTGHYAVDVRQWHCRDTSTCLLYLGVGSQDPARSTPWTIFPNPTGGTCAVALDHPASWIAIDLVDLSGKLLARYGFADATHATLDLSHLAAGIYFLDVTADSVRRVLKVVKQ